jgi:hypothetical protein
MAAADVLIHSSAGLTVLEAIIRGCPVVSYGFNYGHVRAANVAMERFGLAQVARKESEIAPAVAHALESRPEPDGRFARRPPTAALILSDERRARTLPRWRVRTTRATATAVAALAVAGWVLTTGTSYSLVSHIGVLVDARASQVPELAGLLAADGIHASFAVTQPSSPVVSMVSTYHDQTLPRLPNGGLVRWLGTRGDLHRLLAMLGLHRHFLYASSGPSLGQWLEAHGAGGRLVAGAVQLKDADDPLGELRPGEVVEVSVTNLGTLEPVLAKLLSELRQDHLSAVSIGRLMRDADPSA